MARSFGNRFRHFVIHSPITIVSIVVVATILAFWPSSTAPYRTSILHSFADDPEALNEFRSKASQLGGPDDAIILAATREQGGIFQQSVLNAIRAAAEELRQVDFVDSVYTITDIPLFRESANKSALRSKLRDGEVPDSSELPKFDLWSDSEGRSNPIRDQFRKWFVENRLRELLLEQPQSVGSLLSKDGESHCMIVKLEESALIDLNSRENINDVVSDVIRKHGLGSEEMHICGMMSTETWMIYELNQTLVKFFPFGALLTVLLVYALFGRLISVFITLLVGVIAIIWSMGITAFTFGEITILVKTIPLLILVISTSDTIHLLTTYYEERKRGREKKEALNIMIKDVGSACLLTSITTLIGFGSLILVPTTAIKHVGVTAGTGVAAALLLAICLVPIILARLPGDDQKARIKFDYVNRFIRWIAMLCCRISLGLPKTCAICFIILGAAALISARHLELDANYPQRFSPQHPFRLSVEFFDKQFNGTTTIDVFVEGDHLLTPSTLECLRSIDRSLTEKEEVTQVTSLTDVFAQLDRMVDLEGENQLPDDPIYAATLLKFMRSVAPEAVESILAIDDRLTRISIQVVPTGFQEIVALTKEIERELEAALPDDLQVVVTGSIPMIAGTVGNIVEGQKASFLTCFLLVTIVIGLGLRSLKLSLLGLLPNLIPMLLLLGLLAICYDFIDTDYIMIFTVCFAISVDDTIHFLNRYKIERRRTTDVRTALESTFQHAGTPIVRTTMVLIIGLLPLAFAQYLTAWMLGTFLVFGLFWAMVADLIFLPALILLVDGRLGRETCSS